jgi:hypothetical protein
MKDRINKLLKYIKDNDVVLEISNEEGLCIIDYEALSRMQDNVLVTDLLVSGDPVGLKTFEFSDNTLYLFLLKMISNDRNKS